MSLSLVSRFLMGGVFAFAAACNSQASDPASRTHLTSAQPAAAPVNLASIDAIALARCDREQRCDNVGAGKTFSNREACLNDIRSKGDNDLTTSACPGGIDTTRLQTCLDAVRTERCDNPLDAVGRLSACRTDSLCPSETRGGP
jgi:hypothetical protein